MPRAPSSKQAPRDVRSSAEIPSPGRQTRRRERTRASLIASARVLLARQGVDNTRINEITDEADVGFGSFYNHFDSKEAIVEAVLAETVAAQGAAIDSVTRHLDDPAEVVSAAHRYFVNLAGRDPDWGWLLVRLEMSHGLMVASLGPHAARDLDRGIRAERFHVASRNVALTAAGGALLAVMRTVLDGRAPKGVDRLHAECVLRMFGLTAEDAADVAGRAMPEIDVAVREATSAHERRRRHTR